MEILRVLSDFSQSWTTRGLKKYADTLDDGGFIVASMLFRALAEAKAVSEELL